MKNTIFKSQLKPRYPHAAQKSNGYMKVIKSSSFFLISCERGEKKQSTLTA